MRQPDEAIDIQSRDYWLKIVEFLQQNWALIEPRRLVPGVWTHCVINVTATAIEAWINGELCVRKLRDYGYYFDSQEEKVLIGNCHAVGEGSNNHFNGMLDDLLGFHFRVPCD